MNYRIKRDDQEFGPYTLSDLQQYVQSGNISAQDLAQSEGMTEWIPVSQILGDIPLPAAASAISIDPGLMRPLVLLPPDLPWPVLLVTYLSLIPFPLFKVLSLFILVWKFIQAFWAHRLSGRNTALVLVSMEITGMVLGVALGGIAAASHMPGLAALGAVPLLAAAICGIVASFKIRDAMEEYYNTVENIGLSMSGVMVFFFNVIYIQFHINRIARWKRTGELS